MLTDYHNHFLPAMDDGAENVEESLQMLTALFEQGIECVVSTPHFYSHRDRVEDFLCRRSAAYGAVMEKQPPLPFVMGAEVYIERDLSAISGVERLAFDKGRIILLEFPYEPLKPWMLDEVYNVAYQYMLTPMLAHIDRYIDMYGYGGVEQMLSIRGSVFQINNASLMKRRKRKLVLELIRGGYPVVFGSDAHNMDVRTPDFINARKVLRAQLSKKELAALDALNESLILGQ